MQLNAAASLIFNCFKTKSIASFLKITSIILFEIFFSIYVIINI